MRRIKPIKLKKAKSEMPKTIKNNKVKRREIKMENVIAIPMDRVIFVGKDFDKFIEMHKEESKKAREMHHRRSIAIKKNRIK